MRAQLFPFEFHCHAMSRKRTHDILACSYSWEPRGLAEDSVRIAAGRALGEQLIQLLGRCDTSCTTICIISWLAHHALAAGEHMKDWGVKLGQQSDGNYNKHLNQVLLHPLGDPSLCHNSSPMHMHGRHQSKQVLAALVHECLTPAVLDAAS